MMEQDRALGSRLLVHIFLLVALCGILFFPYLGNTPFFDKGEPREAMAVQDIMRRGEWLVPLKRATDIPSKPPLFHWSAALVSEMTGKLDEATIRFPSAFYATVGVLLVYAFGRTLFGGGVALLGGTILATTMIYQNQALSARVDMTLCFFVTLSLVLFYSLYRGFLTGQFWFYVFYAVCGIGTLAKGPLGILLPGLTAGTFLALKRRWALLAKFCFHPGVLLTIVLGAGWYVVAVTRGGEGFIDRQLLQENLNRFFGGSGHSHPFYYYISYLFSLGLPWTLFLPFLLWDVISKNFRSQEDALFLWVWFVVMFVFFSISAGKRPVYLLPLYPALSLLLAQWFQQQVAAHGGRMFIYRFMAVFAAIVGFGLLVITLGGLWSHDPEWFFTPIEALLKAKDRANLVIVKDALATFGWSFTIVALASGLLWFSLAHCLWLGKLNPAAQRLVWISILMTFVTRTAVMPAIAGAKSYRDFMDEVNKRVGPDDKLYLYGASFNSDPVVFYRGEPIATLEGTLARTAGKVGSSQVYVIMAEKDWTQMQRDQHLGAPLLTSRGTGPEGDAQLVLVAG